MTETISRRNFLKDVIALNAASVLGLLSFRKEVIAADQNFKLDEIAISPDLNDSHQLAVDPISVHHKPSIIYVEG